MKIFLDYLLEKSMSLWEFITFLVVMFIVSDYYTITVTENKDSLTLYLSIFGVYFVSSFLRGLCGVLRKDLEEN